MTICLFLIGILLGLSRRQLMCQSWWSVLFTDFAILLKIDRGQKTALLVNIAVVFIPQLKLYSIIPSIRGGGGGGGFRSLSSPFVVGQPRRIISKVMTVTLHRIG